ncbi:hypothetical protein OF83DRAFT_1180724 [Amylostereum chailletii]|nr:hypothetical protein OF83DRAFT_1180724 [Amylostereum chailletii]
MNVLLLLFFSLFVFALSQPLNPHSTFHQLLLAKHNAGGTSFVSRALSPLKPLLSYTTPPSQSIYSQFFSPGYPSHSPPPRRLGNTASPRADHNNL